MEDWPWGAGQMSAAFWGCQVLGPEWLIWGTTKSLVQKQGPLSEGQNDSGLQVKDPLRKEGVFQCALPEARSVGHAWQRPARKNRVDASPRNPQRYELKNIQPNSKMARSWPLVTTVWSTRRGLGKTAAGATRAQDPHSSTLKTRSPPGRDMSTRKGHIV
jgi:hypothetical protein